MKKKLIIFISTWLFPKITLAAASIENPLKAQSIPELISYIIRGILGVVGALALFYFVWGGIVWMTSAGNSERVKKGKDTIVWAVFGLVIIFLSYTITRFIFTAMGQ